MEPLAQSEKVRKAGMLRFVNRVDALPFMRAPAGRPRNVVYEQGIRALAES